MRINKKVKAQTKIASESVCIGTALTSTDVHAAVLATFCSFRMEKINFLFNFQKGNKIMLEMYFFLFYLL